MNLNSVNRIYFIGIGGIGMSALARYFKFINKDVAGYDRTASDITKGLQNTGIDIHYEDAIDRIPQVFRDKEGTLIVYTPAIPADHREYNYFKEQGFDVYKRSQVLGMITRDSFCLAVAGTHGKTTTSSILAHILNETGTPLTAFLGGISEDFNSNFLISGKEVTVVEADEYDRSFLQLSPDIACITSMDADHLDIYGEKSALDESFREFTKRLKPNGTLFVRKGLPIDGITYGIEDGSDYCIKNLKIKNATYVFDVETPKESIRGVQFNKPGQHNLLNSLVAFAMAVQMGSPPDRLAKALATFKGVKRRFSYQIRTDKLVFIDDYAHHPTEIEAVYNAVKEMYPGKKVLAVFQPHLFSRTRDFADGFARQLSRFDEVILLEIYPAREEPIEGVNSSWLMDKMENRKVRLLSKEELIEAVKHTDAEVVLTMGAGDIGVEVDKIKNALLDEN
ncbi:UDP-N-acetylmuramate--L-alanine ligase [Leptobacterium flavescens]|uniref:UDP-N-acetylmuramate--L-alanine ligase n=1 Tax=Leptobacterium flavescens TaxID=472055 RepID=A0A6P0UHK0_9FLAO|nr:UDP-N-acetylmuramate--L-alanine ligase [Leptobacterium flavescens]NER12477.1 UDP-N-acetylmuramate--L-alanine ligase [Leptobacterium flavescens]